MKKFLLSIFAVLFAFAGVQAQEVTLDFTKNTWGFPSSSTNKTTSSKTYTSGSYSIVLAGGGSNNGHYFNSDGYLINGKSSATLTLPAFDFAVSKIEVVGRSGASSSTEQNIYVGTTAVSTATIGSGGTNTYEINEAYQAAGNVYVLKISSKHNAQYTKIKIYKTAGGGEVAPTLAAPTVSVADGSKIDLGTVITFTPAAGNTLEYAIADEGLSPVEDETLEIEATTAGQLSITVKSICGEESEEYKYVYYVMPNKPVISAADDTFEESLEVSIEAEDGDIYYTLDGNDPTEDSTPYAGAFTITETTTVKAIAVVDGVASKVASATYKYVDPNLVISNSTISFANTTQRVSQSKTQQVWSNGTINFTNNKSASQSDIVDSSNPVKCYASSSIILECVSGNITEILFDCNNSSYATALNNSFDNTVISIVSGDKVTVTLDGTSNTFIIEKLSAQVRMDAVTVTYAESATPTAPYPPTLMEPQEFRGSMIVAISNIAADATVYYTTDESDPATSATRVEYTEPFEITATTTIKAVAVNEVGASEMVTATYTLFVVEETTGYYIKVVSAPADWSGKYLIVYEEGTDAYVFNGKDEANGYVSAVTDGDVIKANSEIDAVAVTIAAMEGGYSVKTADGYIYGTSGSNKLNTNASEPQLNTIEFTADGVNIEAGRYLRFNSAKGDMRFRYYNLTYGESVHLYKYVEELPSYHTPTGSDAGYATLFLDFNAAIPTNVEAYAVTKVNNGYVTLTQVEGVLPANTGVIVKATEDDYTFAYSKETPATVTGNLLQGTVDATEIDVEAYVLGIVDGVVGLYKAEMAGGVWLNNANKAYLPASALTALQNTVAFYGFDWEGTTGVEKVEIRNEKEEIYDLCGRRIEMVTAPGIYIINGKKVLVK